MARSGNTPPIPEEIELDFSELADRFVELCDSIMQKDPTYLMGGLLGAAASAAQSAGIDCEQFLTSACAIFRKVEQHRAGPGPGPAS